MWKNLRGGVGECRGTQSATCCIKSKSGSVGIWQDRFRNVGSVLGRHPGRGSIGGQRSPTLVDALPSGHPFSHLMQHAGKRWAYSTSPPSPPPHRGECYKTDISELGNFEKSKS